MFRQMPTPLKVTLGSVMVAIIILAGTAAGAAINKTTYDLIREVFIPLLGSCVAVLIPTVLFYVIPLGQNRQRGAIELFNGYHTEEMRRARNEAWQFFVTERQTLSEKERDQRLDDYLDYLTRPESGRKVSSKLDEIYQKLSRILDFFALVNGSLERGTVDGPMVRSFMGYYYLWWRDEILTPLRNRPERVGKSTWRKPEWLKPLKALDAVCEAP